MAADYDGDRKADISVFRPSEGNWYRLNSNGGSFFGMHFGLAEDKPVAADYDGDGKTDIGGIPSVGRELVYPEFDCRVPGAAFRGHRGYADAEFICLLTGSAEILGRYNQGNDPLSRSDTVNLAVQFEPMDTERMSPSPRER